MAFISQFFMWLAPNITAWAVTFFSRKMLVATTTVGTFVLLTAAFVVCIKQIISTVMALAIMPSWLSYGLGVFVPSDFAAVLSAILASQSCRWAYDKAMDKMRLINGAT